MNVLFVAAEVAPLIKTGGLADVAGALPASLRALGHDVRVVMPYYRQLRDRGISVEGPIAASFLPLGERDEELRIWRAVDAVTPTYLLDIPAAFERASIYGDGDDDRRFILFSRGVLALMQQLREVAGWQPDVVHAHDWHAALVSNYIRTTHAYTFGHVATVFTIHNLAYQGQFSTATLGASGLSERGLIENGMGPGTAGTFNFMARGIVHSGVVIGADGFGFAPFEGRWEKIAQLGGVTIGDDVEIGANTCIDRGALDDTVLEDGVKLDNLVQIGHNVRVGAHSAFAGCVGVAGSARIGRHCTAGGGAIILGHLEIVDHVNISAATVITRSIHKAGTYSGMFPFDDNASWEKNAATLRQLHALRDRLRALEKKA